MIIIGNQVNICLNASTMTIDEIADIDKQTKNKVQPFHNFYPKTLSGLGCNYFKSVNTKLKSKGYKIFAFIPSNKKRGPIFDGLPMVEKHRYKSPQYNFIDMKYNFGVDVCFFGDAIDEEFIKNINNDVLNIKLKENKLNIKGIKHLRRDKSNYIARVVESRQQMVNNFDIKPEENKMFKAGDVVIDNNDNKRYVGEIQIVLKDFSSNKFNKISELEDKGIIEFINEYEEVNFT